jgi:hypothetical protein
MSRDLRCWSARGYVRLRADRATGGLLGLASERLELALPFRLPGSNPHAPLSRFAGS